MIKLGSITETEEQEEEETEIDNNEWKKLKLMEKTIFRLNEANIVHSAQVITDLFNNNYSYSFNIIILKMIYQSFAISTNDVKLYFDFLKIIETFEESKQYKYKIFDMFEKLLYDLNTSESNYLLAYMNEVKAIINKSRNFWQYMTSDEINRMNYPDIDKLSKNDFALHKQLIKEGHNPNEIAQIIRNDEIEKLQEISSQSNFDFNQTIEPSLYERCSFINHKNVTLIDYAAFFSSVKCFKYLLMNGSKVENTGKYAVVGGNPEIIHLCEQNHSSFYKAYETAIEFHRNDIFRYLYENKIGEINKIEELGKICILNHNYEILRFLLKENGLKINLDLFEAAVDTENLYLTKHFIKDNKIPQNILLMTKSENVELFQFLLKQKIFDIDAKDIYLISLIFVLII